MEPPWVGGTKLDGLGLILVNVSYLINFHLSFQVLSIFTNIQIRSISFLTSEWKDTDDCLIWFQIKKCMDQVQ